ncbi:MULTISPECIES: NAD(P)-dependent oxidoreductase [unclassified Sphingobium]|uniref:NAD(P)-dependent oxidoreductase n=1 Tax=unclassified Sphingobium TaxID=2611147 RepID=UPI000D1622E2|nr:MULTISPECIES: NAD(P)-dependent oxidoreductase [unclassified Sphingobium]MBG6119977.1 3-hydroxyisobutyrate dehydrogenase-like beta-hydroxyacid dehydrogenase [Sphingobium sp. JAI105]PSO11856.1 hypothetical protein C7E20_10440 [Sphingobium sp. AEW4]TWC99584.1 3-hydroxyisobutyrate dehydrogenase-like beta-hydroxyacid dehydrogenase [Sphingobium sp. AEW010]TWD18979.1 3-hydroxyisobutyrate dehydrogenase-like beta-hydroxyacid dehydrogenase [Sphingobium sp. AEW013]TWD21850.1 3-hydroxyisobutyrate dehyd
MSMIGFIGLGNQGAPIARRIAARFPTMVWARRAEACAQVPQAAVAATVAEMGRQCTTVALCVRNDDDVKGVAAKLAETMPPGGILIVHSTVLPETVIELAETMAKRGIAVVDAPVSGGPDRAELGEMVVLAGARRADFDAVRPILESFAKLVEHLGDVGAGQRMKLINNGLFFANAAGGAAAIALAGELGIDVAAASRILSAGTGQSTAFDMLNIAGGGLERLADSALVRKDIDHLADIAAGASPAATMLVEFARRLGDHLHEHKKLAQA